MTSSSLARGLFAGLWLLFLLVPAAFTAEPGTTSSRTAAKAASAPSLWVETPTTRRLRARAIRYRAIARRWRALMEKPRPELRDRPRFGSLLAKRRWLARRWQVKAVRAREAGHRPPHRGQWLCIHRWEGSWHDPYPPYYGGLQMDIAFQRTYGRALLRRKGTADRWTRLEQMWVAERAFRRGRGFYPWPVAARRCGLI